MRYRYTVLQLNQEEGTSRSFKVDIHFWDKIETCLCEFGRATADFIVWGKRDEEESFEPVQAGTVINASLMAEPDNKIEYPALYPGIDKLLKDRKLEAAEHEISKLPDPEQNTVPDAWQRSEILGLKAKLAFERSQYKEVARLFDLSYAACPERPQARLNRVLALEFSREQERAFTESEKLLAEGMKSAFLVWGCWSEMPASQLTFLCIRMSLTNMPWQIAMSI